MSKDIDNKELLDYAEELFAYLQKLGWKSPDQRRIRELEEKLRAVEKWPDKWIEIYGWDKFDVADWLRDELEALLKDGALQTSECMFMSAHDGPAKGCHCPGCAAKRKRR